MKKTYLLTIFILTIIRLSTAQDILQQENDPDRGFQAGTGYNSASASFVPDKGYRGFVEVGYTVGFGDFSMNRYEVLTTHGLQFNTTFFLGGGTGFQFYRFTSTEITMPVFACFRLNFKEDGDISPFMSINLGYTFYLSADEVDDLGVYFAPAFGVKYIVTPRIAPHISLGYTLQHINSYDSYVMNGINIRVGVEF